VSTENMPAEQSPIDMEKLPPSLRDAIAKYGVVPSALKAPRPKLVQKSNLDALCTLKWPVSDPETGEHIPGVEAHSGPMMYLRATRSSADDNPKFKTKFDNYVGFMNYTVWHPIKGEHVFTHGIPDAGGGTAGTTELMEFLSELEPGNWFQVGMFRTNSGYRLFKPIPVQQPPQ
jgi:hypothetical protein